MVGWSLARRAGRGWLRASARSCRNANTSFQRLYTSERRAHTHTYIYIYIFIYKTYLYIRPTWIYRRRRNGGRPSVRGCKWRCRPRLSRNYPYFRAPRRASPRHLRRSRFSTKAPPSVAAAAAAPAASPSPSPPPAARRPPSVLSARLLYGTGARPYTIVVAFCVGSHCRRRRRRRGRRRRHCRRAARRGVTRHREYRRCESAEINTPEEGGSARKSPCLRAARFGAAVGVLRLSGGTRARANSVPSTLADVVLRFPWEALRKLRIFRVDALELREHVAYRSGIKRAF